MTTEDMNWTDVLGPRIQTVSSPTGPESDHCVIRAIMGRGVLIPLHSHDDRETICVLSGTVEVHLDGRWQRVVAGGVLDIKCDARHALRNQSGEDAHVLLITTTKMKRFLDEIGRPVPQVPAPPSPELLGRMQEVAQRYGYWLASPLENLQIGIAM